MDAQKDFRVDPLSTEATQELFRLTVGERVMNADHEIPKLAEIVAKECKGMPLALVTVGRAMARRTTVEEWRHAINMLQSYPSKFSGMGNNVFPTLKLSYDCLSDTLKTCFLYCSLFLEDRNVPQKEVIELWIGEGLLENFDNICSARDEGKTIIESLKRACLLEKSDAPGIFVKPEDLWKMHDVIYDMALWLASEEGNNILVAKHINLNKAKEVAKWKEAVRISLWGPKIEFHRETPYCPRLRTLLVKNTILMTFPNNFFQSMPQLQVLDLSYNLDLTELPVGIGELINLQYLNLSDTDIRRFPIEVKDLSRLRMLLLDDMKNLEAIPSGVISCLSSLQVFSRFFGGSNELHYQSFDDITLLHELESLEDINEIGLTLFTLESIIKFKASPKLQTCSKGLTIKCSGLLLLDIPCSIMRRIENLEILTICDCESLKELKILFRTRGQSTGIYV